LQRYPSVAGGIGAIKITGGKFVVTWQSNNQNSESGNGIYGQIYNSDGSASGSEFKVHTTTYNATSTGPTDKGNPSVSALKDGGFVVTWESFDQDAPSTYGIYGQRFDSYGNMI
jgi:hypothetical protein